MTAKVRHNQLNQDPNDNLLKSDLPTIRQVSLPDGWRTATPGSVGEFTRVGFCFARQVQQELNLPIGLLNSCVGGSSIESWMRIEPGNLPAGPAGKKREYGKLYRERVALLVGYGMRGALWYQGEANSNEGHEYFLKMQSMINDWRALWDLGDFPFYIVQLAGISESPMDDPAMGDGRARIREAQRHVLTMNHTGMAVAVDIGEKKDYVSAVPVADAELRWLSIQAKDGTWHWAEARIDSSDLIVSSKDAKEPIAVRYAYTNYPDGVYLYNAAGLPASPFAPDTKNERAPYGPDESGGFSNRQKSDWKSP